MAERTPSSAHGSESRSRGRGFRRLWAEHEEGVLYAIAVVVYIPAGVFLKTIVLNWFVGITFPVVVVYLIPAAIRRWRRGASAELRGSAR